jgi:D-glycero-beta-D-manno-heptose 1-phosphate adenylyltransferase
VPGQVLDLIELQAEINGLRESGMRIVLTNGVFDLLHVGHLRYLRLAKREGDILVVGVNADATVRKHGRPLVPDHERAELVAALDPVDYVVIFHDLTADALLHALHPDVYAKGADYATQPLPEAPTAREVGARIVLIPLTPNHSSSTLAAKLQDVFRDNALPPFPGTGRGGSGG